MAKLYKRARIGKKTAFSHPHPGRASPSVAILACGDCRAPSTETLSDEDLEALIARAEEILRPRVRKTLLTEDPAIGMWKDREEMKDSAAWVREMRQHEWRDRD